MEMKMICCVGVVMAMMIVSGYGGVGAITCEEAAFNLLSCVPFLTGPAKEPGEPCCSAATAVLKEVDTTEERRTLCDCLKQAAGSFGFDFKRVKELTDSCRIQSPVPIDPNVDCKSIPFVLERRF